MPADEPPIAVDPDTWHRAKYNPWARLVVEAVGPWLESRGARYGSCGVVDAAGTREISWVFERGPDSGPRRRRRVLLFRALEGDKTRWEVVLSEERAPWDLDDFCDWLHAKTGLALDLPGWPAPVYHYNSLSRRCSVDGLAAAAEGLLADGLGAGRPSRSGRR